MQHDEFEGDELSLFDLAQPLLARWRLMLATPVVAGILGVAGTFLIRPTFASTTLLIPPLPQQSAAASALSSLSALAGLAGGNLPGTKSPADQYVSLMQSVTVRDRLVERFKLMDVYDVQYRQDAQNALASNVRFEVGKKDGLISVTVEDHDAKRAAAIANQYVEELRHLTANLAISEAQQRRVFFEQRLQETKGRLIEAQTALQDSGFSDAAIKAEPKAAAEGYARLRAELTAAEVRLQTSRSSLTEVAPEVQQLTATVSALRSQLAAMERSAEPRKGGPDYVSKYREFKYQETLFDLFAKQFEVARLDESREGSLIQVVDVAKPAERKSKPKRLYIGLAASVLSTMLMAAYLITRYRMDLRRRAAAPDLVAPSSPS